MLFPLIVFMSIVYFLYWYENKFKSKLSETIKSFVSFEKTLNFRTLYLTNWSLNYYLFSDLKEFVINIEEEHKTNNLAKKLHKIKGNLLLIIDFDKVDTQQILPIIKSLEAYSKMNGNIITTYIPYKAKDSSSLLSLVGKKIIFGNYATLSSTKLDQSVLSTIGQYYSTSVIKKITDAFNNLDNVTTIYTCNELTTMKLSCSLEDKESNEFKLCIKNIMMCMETLNNCNLI